MPQLIVVEQGKEERRAFPCNAERMGIGRLGTNAVVLNHEGVSRNHAEVLQEGDDFFLLDLGSDNGTLLNNALIQKEERYLLRNGDVITINGYHIHFSRADQLEQSFNDITDSEILEVKMLKKVLNALDQDELPSLEVLNGHAEGRKHIIAEDQEHITIGRDSTCDFPVDEYVISRQHCRLSKQGEQILVEDLQSKNGTYINNERISDQRVLYDGDRIACGTIVFLFRNPSSADLDAVSEELREQSSKSKPSADDAHDFTNEETTGTEEAEIMPDELTDRGPAQPYPTPKARRSWISRMSNAEIGLLWAGIMVFMITVVLIVKLFD